jgi:hypothetical protein
MFFRSRITQNATVFLYGICLSNVTQNYEILGKKHSQRGLKRSPILVNKNNGEDLSHLSSQFFDQVLDIPLFFLAGYQRFDKNLASLNFLWR